MTAFSPCVIIPVYNHYAALDGILSRLAALDLPVIVIDDGNDTEIASRIADICQSQAAVERLRHEFNGGKGFAVLRGLARARERGFTHALQIDGDGQHDLAAVDQLIATARANPEALVLGKPRFDATIPSARRFGRQLTQFWVRVNTLFAPITDTMCGFRAYPVNATLALGRREIASRRMEFDIEVVVRWSWQGMPIAGVPVGVVYPEGNTSNFDVVRDNILISGTHARLFFGMLARIPKLLKRRIAGQTRVATLADAPAATDATHWSGLAERGAFWGLWILANAYKLLGRRVCNLIMYPVVGYFFLTGREQRQASADYLNRAWRHGILKSRPTSATSHEHFQAFGHSALDKFAAWTGRLTTNDIDDVGGRLMAATRAGGRGIVVITAHLGNPEVLRALANTETKFPINVLLHDLHAVRFNSLIEQVAPRSRVRVFQVSRIGPDTTIMLSEAVDRGEWVVIAGDRVAVAEKGARVVRLPFLGEPAPFPQGPIILAALLKCPIYLMFCLRDGPRIRVHFDKLSDPVALPRRNKSEVLQRYVGMFVEALEMHVAEAPLQWFNFYNFWNPPGLHTSASAATSMEMPRG